MAGKTYTCIVCPVSCRITVEEQGDDFKIEGYTCNRGRDFARMEHTDPTRVLTSTVKVIGCNIKRLPIISAKEVPKHKLRECLDMVYKATVKPPVKCGDVVISDICGTGVNVLAAKNL
jgi:CxxC motif-containing protein